MSDSTPRYAPQVRDGRVAEHIQCARCGYDLYGLEVGAACSECGAVGEYDRYWKQRRMVRRFATGVLIAAGATLGVHLIFRAALAIQGLRLMDLWGSGRIRPLCPQAVPFVTPGLRLVHALLWVISAIGLFTVTVAAFTTRYRDRAAWKLIVCASLAILLSGCLTVESCAILGGL